MTIWLIWFISYDSLSIETVTGAPVGEIYSFYSFFFSKGVLAFCMNTCHKVGFKTRKPYCPDKRVLLKGKTSSCFIPTRVKLWSSRVAVGCEDVPVWGDLSAVRYSRCLRIWKWNTRLTVKIKAALSYADLCYAALGGFNLILWMKPL